MNIISFKDISKSYGANTVINAINFDIKKGQVFGLLGPNGAGKTTIMRLMTKISLPDSGDIFFKDKLFEKKDVLKIGYMPEERGLYTNMKIFEHLFYIAKLYGLDSKVAKNDIDFWLTKLGMISFSNRYIGALSKGMSQKIQFIAIVLHRPELLVLDEPFSGLDPISLLAIEKEILELRSSGTSVILSTHRMDQIETFCDEVLLINNGQKIVQGSIAKLKDLYKENIISISTAIALPEAVKKSFDTVFQEHNTYYLKYQSDQDRRDILKCIMDNNIPIISFNERLPAINEIFIKLIERDLTEKKA